MKYKIIHDRSYDFQGESYGAELCPNIHRYPATMIPQVGIKVLNDLGIHQGSMLDPYCGSGSSFLSGLYCGITDFIGFDLNPLALLITKVRLTSINPDEIDSATQKLKEIIYEERPLDACDRELDITKFTNFLYWFNPRVANDLQIVKDAIKSLTEKRVRDFCLLALSSTIRSCSYTRNNEFKLYRMKEEEVLAFNPDVFGVFFHNLKSVITIYKKYYYHLLDKDKTDISLHNSNFNNKGKEYDVILTSPPYGDSRTTVAYGQFSIFANSWICGLEDARSLDKKLMGGSIKKTNEVGGLITKCVKEIEIADKKRGVEIRSFYIDLADSISKVVKAIKPNGHAVYVVGNRIVKGVTLPTDQFIAEQFEKNGLKHLATFDRAISNKRMPRFNSPTNKAGEKMSTMNQEFIVIGQHR